MITFDTLLQLIDTCWLVLRTIEHSWCLLIKHNRLPQHVTCFHSHLNRISPLQSRSTCVHCVLGRCIVFLILSWYLLLNYVMVCDEME